MGAMGIPGGSETKEKSNVALSSVLAAVGLTLVKIVVGIATRSLGILAEAAHSGLDLAAAIMTLFAVRTADRPADRDHLFGHGKVENLSALFETVLLLATSAWIIYEALERLLFREVHVDASIWAFAVMIVSIVVDFSRSRMLYRAARKYNSQALEADALHFSTDIWSSSVVILGLGGVWLADRYPSVAVLAHADGVAALVVALIVIYVSVRLGCRTIQSLLDAAPQGLAEEIQRAVVSLQGVEDCHQVRVRPSGARWFVDLHVTMDGTRSLTDAHAATEEIEKEIRRLVPNADITVHTEPASP
jgi:cation diffusion facilitator family transporter